MAIQHTESATLRLGLPHSEVERGTIDHGALSYVRNWTWPCGCRGEIIAGTLIELDCCAHHKRAA